MLKYWSLILMMGLLQVNLGRPAGAEGTPETLKVNGKPITLAHYAKAFIGQGNVTVEVAPYKMGEEDGAILLFHGIESEWDGKAINHTLVPAAYHGQSYDTIRQGRTWSTLISRQGANGMRYELYVPGIKDAIALTPSDGAAQLTSPSKIFQQYQDQQKAKK